MPFDVFEALADPTRRRILDVLRQGERPVGELVDLLGVAQPNVSKHLRTLDAAALVRVRVDGPRRHYALDPAGMRPLDAWLAPYREAWAERLDALEQHLDDLPEEPWIETEEGT
jgi:DNA-binding transcriptional ArsR family regulator